MEPLKLARDVAIFLKDNAEKRFTARELATWVVDTYPEESQAKQDRSNGRLTSKEDIIGQYRAEIGSQRNNIGKRFPNKIKTTEERPRRYYYTEEIDNNEDNEIVTEDFVKKQQQIQHDEHSLYPILTTFLSSELGIYSKRINEKYSSNSKGAGGNQWLHPDLVGMENLSEHWHPEVRNCVGASAIQKTKLWSFEVKIELTMGTVRKSFFQTVSNSSWANLGYLVAAEITTDALKELRLLSSLHGIGVIQLNSENPPESQILIPARERKEADWDTIDRIAKENPDFKAYVQSIRQFYQMGEVDITKWDKGIIED